MCRVLFVSISVVATVCAACSSGPSKAPAVSRATGSPAAPSSTTPSPTTPPPATPSTPARPSPTHVAAADRAARRISSLAGELGHGGYSVAIRDMRTGATFTAGASHGMYEGSIAKLDIVETLMLQHQRAHTSLSSSERDLVTDMIEHSDNHAADTLWTREGGRDAVADANKSLGLHHTKLGPGIYWGFSTTSATDQIALLHALVDDDSPLSDSSQDYIRGLMRDVEADQRWGVATLAGDPDDTPLKNGWLPNSLDGGRWLVNSLGIVKRGGHTYLMAVLTQHGASFGGGISLTEQIARAALDGLR